MDDKHFERMRAFFIQLFTYKTMEKMKKKINK